MKELKAGCLQSLNKQIKASSLKNCKRGHKLDKDETYTNGLASYRVTYNTLEYLLPKHLTKSYTPSTVYLAILHLANEHRFRLIKASDNFNVFFIREII